jgi:hypothetical protein
MFRVLEKYMSQQEEPIAQWRVAHIIYSKASHNPFNMFPKQKLNGEIQLLAEVVLHNEIMVKDHELITNQELIPRTLGIVKYGSIIDPADSYFQISIDPAYKNYNTIEMPIQSIACKVLLQGQSKAPGIAMQAIDHELQCFIERFM